MAKLGTAEASVVQTSTVDKLTEVQRATKIERKPSLILIGPVDSGKTITLCTASENCPDAEELLRRANEGPPEQADDLGDILIIETDVGGIDSVGALGLDPLVIDLSKAPEESMPGALLYAIDKAEKMVQAGEVKVVALDGLTSLNHILWNKYSKLAKINKWDAVLNDNMQVYGKLRELPCDTIFVSHGKAVGAPMASTTDPNAEAVGQAKLDAKGLEPGDIKLNILGQSEDFYVNNTSLILPVTKRGARGKEKFFIHPKGFGRFINKCRFPFLPDVMPADLHELFRRIKAGR